MLDSFFKKVRCDKSNKWVRNKIDVLANKEVKCVLEDLDMNTGDFCDLCKGNGCEICDDGCMSKYSNSWQEYEWLNEWLDGDNKQAYFTDGEHKPVIKIGDKI